MVEPAVLLQSLVAVVLVVLQLEGPSLVCVVAFERSSVWITLLLFCCIVDRLLYCLLY